MTWTPRHEAHAIERVRLMFTFKDPLTAKLLSNAIAGTLEKAQEYGFDTIEDVSQKINFEIQQDATVKQSPNSPNGKVLKRIDNGIVLEEVGFRDVAFGYVTTTYGRWKNLRNRIEEVFMPALENVENAIELRAVKLEYWDRFLFDGPIGKADATSLLADMGSELPPAVLAGSSQWHSHVGWFDYDYSHPLLINRNIDVVDQKNDNETTVRTLGILSLVELREGETSIEVSQVGDILELLHNRSLRLLGETLREDSRKAIGLDIRDYQ